MNRRKTKWALSIALTVLFCVGTPCLEAGGPSAKSLYKQGEAAEEKGDIIAAYEDFAQAFQKDPKNLRYKTDRERTRYLAGAAHVALGEKLLGQGDNSGALTEFLRALEIDPSNDLARQDIAETKEKISAPVVPNQETSVSPSKSNELSEVGAPIELKPVSNEPITLHMTEDSKIVYETVGKAAGINVLFDPEYTSKRIQIDLTNVSLIEALRIIGTVSGTFWHPITANTIFVAADTRAKRQELEEEAVQTFYLGNTAEQNDLNDIQTALRNLLTGAKLYGVPSQNAIVMRATPDELLLAQKLISDLDKPRPEVVVDVALIEVNRDKTRNIGVQLPGSFGLQLQPPNATSTSTSGTSGTTGTSTTSSTQNLTLNNIANLNATNFAVTVGTATANLLLSDTDTKVLQNPSIRATDGQKADLKIGERIPVATGSYQTGAATAIVSSLVNTQFTYLDVGVEIEITPTVHYNRDVTLKIKLVSSQEAGSTTIGGITEPIISQRTAEQTVRLREGEVNILGGYLVKQDLLSVGGTPGLGELPILKYFFSSQQHEIQNDEIIFMLTPHVVRATSISPLNLKEIDTGTGSNVELRRVDVEPLVKPTPIGTAMPPVAAVPAPANIPAPAANAAPAAAPAPVPPGMSLIPNVKALTQPAVRAAPGESVLIVPPTAPQKVGASFQIPVNISGAQDVDGVPLMLHYDKSKLTLTNVDSGEFLGHDGQAVALVHRDDGSGMVVISASRPPGVTGVSGAGVVCLLTFQAVAPGDASISVVRAAVQNSSRQTANLTGSEAWVHIQ